MLTYYPCQVYVPCIHICMYQHLRVWLIMMTSSNGIFRITGPLWGEFTSHWWIPLTKASDAELWRLLWSVPEQRVEQAIETLVIWDAIVLIMTPLLCFILDCDGNNLAEKKIQRHIYNLKHLKYFITILWNLYPLVRWLYAQCHFSFQWNVTSQDMFKWNWWYLGDLGISCDNGIYRVLWPQCCWTAFHIQ